MPKNQAICLSATILIASAWSLAAQEIDSTAMPSTAAAHGSGTGSAMLQVAADTADEVLRFLGLQGAGYTAGAPADRVYPPALGTNLSPVVDWSSGLPFSNLFKSSRTWLTQCSQWSDPPDPGCTGQWNTEETQLLDLDEHGWVKSLPAPDDPAMFTCATAYWALYPEFPPGRYLVFYDGEGSIEYGLGASLLEDLSMPGRHVIQIDPADGMTLSITRTDPKGVGDYIRNIQVVREGLSLWVRMGTTPVFDAKFVDLIEPFQALRFMDWMRTNDQPPGTWSERPRIDDARMGRVYKQYLAMWQLRGGELFMNFTDIERPGRYRAWGVLEHVGQASSPKYDALLEYLGTRPL